MARRQNISRNISTINPHDIQQDETVDINLPNDPESWSERESGNIADIFTTLKSLRNAINEAGQNCFFKFCGIVSKDAPQNDTSDTYFSDGTLWLVSDYDEKDGLPALLEGEFWRCHVITGGVWSVHTNWVYGTPSLTTPAPNTIEKTGDLWFNRNINTGY
jgi:hypothetical protein